MLFLYLSDGYLIGMLIWLVIGMLSLFALLSLRRRLKTKPGWRRIVSAGLASWMVLALVTIGEIGFALCYDTTDTFNETTVSKRWNQIHDSPDRKRLRVGGGTQIIYRDNVTFPTVVSAEQHHILFTGDSFTVGHGIKNVDDRFSNLIRKSLEESHPGRFLVSNLSDGGRDLFWVSAMLSHLLNSDSHVDTVVYVICLNDIETFSPDYQKFYASFSNNSPRFFLLRDTYLLNFLYFRLMQYRMSAISDYYASLTSLYQGEPWDRMTQMLEMLHSECRDRNIELKIAIFPFMHDTDGDYDCAPAHKVISEFCKSSKISCLDLASDLLPHIHEGLTVNAFDAHPNERAHELAAKAIRTKLLADLTNATR